MSDSSATDIYTQMRSAKWSHEEKVIARRAFDHALHQEFEETIAEFRKRAERVKEADDVWELEGWIAARRKKINEKYDYRYSVLPMVFGILIREGRLNEDDLRGLSENKLGQIRTWTVL